MIIDKKQFKTSSNYWGFVNKKDFVNKSFFNFINRLLLFFLKIKIIRKPSNLRPEQESYLSNNLIKLRNKELAIHLLNFFKSANFKTNRSQILKHIKEFEKTFKIQPISNLNKGMGYNNSLITFIIIKLISPKNIIESGVLRGYSTYLIEKSINKKAKIYAYDINFSLREYKSKKAIYFESDVTHDDSINNRNFDLAIFDDHVSHLDRILFSKENNIKYIILDDDVSVFTLHSDGWPPIPTANMIYNYGKIPKTFDWTYKNNLAKARIKNLNKINLRKDYKYLQYPNLFNYTGYKNTSETSILIKL